MTKYFNLLAFFRYLIAFLLIVFSSASSRFYRLTAKTYTRDIKGEYIVPSKVVFVLEHIEAIFSEGPFLLLFKSPWGCKGRSEEGHINHKEQEAHRAGKDTLEAFW